MAVIKIAYALSLTLASMATPALAQDSPQTHVPRDPNERVCEDVTQVGSRLATQKICATRAEWAEKRKADRETVDQVQRSANVGCGVINTHSGTPTCN
jgi:hypothetical protein